jgi:hypothetical protein
VEPDLTLPVLALDLLGLPLFSVIGDWALGVVVMLELLLERTIFFIFFFFIYRVLAGLYVAASSAQAFGEADESSCQT